MAGEVVLAGALAAVNQTIFTSATVTTTTAGSKIIGLDGYSRALYFLQVSTVTGTSPTFDVAIQVLMPDNTTWQSIANFTQATGTANRYIWKVAGATAEAATATSLAAASQNNLPPGLTTRVNVVVGGTNPSATVKVTAHYLR